jgi:hypothetical protein
MLVRGLVGAMFTLLEVPGLVLFAYAVVVVGSRGVSTRGQRIWGGLGRLSRARFTAYFAVLGLAWSLAVHQFWFSRGERPFLIAAAVAGAVALVLLTGWLVALCRKPTDQITT